MNSRKQRLELFFLRPIRWVWRVCSVVIGVVATAARIPEADEDGYLTGVYNFRTRKFDDGTDPFGWYEEDL